MDIFGLITVMSFFTIGYTPVNNELLLDSNYKSLIYTDIGINVKYKGFSAGGNTKTTIVPISLVSYKPIQDYYTLTIGYEYSFLKLNYLHECQHIVSANFYYLPSHKNRARDEVILNFERRFSYCDFNYTVNVGVGCLLKNAESFFYDERYYAFCGKKNTPIFSVDNNISYKNFYAKINSKVVVDFDYSILGEFGLNFKLKNAELFTGIALLKRDNFSIDYADYKNKFNSKDRIDIFIRIAK